jgi:hypothetical protein
MVAREAWTQGRKSLLRQSGKERLAGVALRAKRKGNAMAMAMDGEPHLALALVLYDKPQVARQFAIGAAKSRLKNAKADRFQSILFDQAYLIRQDGARA